MNSNDELMERIEKFRNSNPAQTSGDIYSFIRQHKEECLVQVGNFVKNFEDFFEEMNLLVQFLNYADKDQWAHNKYLQYLFYPETMKTLHRAFEDVMDGYYDESMMLLRSVFEVIVKMAFLSCYPNEWEAVLYDRKGKMNFEVTGFLKDHLKLDWIWLYKIMCKIHHGKIPLHLDQLTRISSGEKKLVIIEYELKKDSLSMGINIVSFLLNCLHHLLMNIFANEIQATEKIKERKIRFETADELLFGITFSNPEEKFRKLGEDLKKLGLIISSADKGENWKLLV